MRLLVVVLSSSIDTMFMMMMNIFCGMVDQKKHGVLFSARVIGGGLHQCKSLEKPQAGFESAQNLSSSFVE